ncbi:hypothetical protein ACFC0D_00985 [Streptomyces sp. NPDC056222]|uniref:hypothetical protein n=1 Tax=Streptomyces sp. NPDC056222 TaxID=3345749 RepID=UPI0035E36753
MADDGGSSGRLRRIDFGTSMLFGAVYASALFLVVTGFALDPSGCGGRFQAACSGGTYWRLGVGFGLIVVVAPGLHKVVPSVPFDQGVGRSAGVAALLLGATLGVALTMLVGHMAG